MHDIFEVEASFHRGSWSSVASGRVALKGGRPIGIAVHIRQRDPDREAGADAIRRLLPRAVERPVFCILVVFMAVGVATIARQASSV